MIDRQHILLTLNRKTNAISALEGTCTCPLGYNCNHVVALLLTWPREMEPRQSGPAVERRGRSSGVENTPVSSQVLYQVEQDVREGELCWRMQEDGTQVPAIHIGKEYPETLPLIPIWSIDARHHQVGELVTELPPHLVLHILQLPVLAPAKARQ